MGILRRSVILLLCATCGWTVEPERLLTILAEAERLGFPPLHGASLQSGDLLPADESWAWLRRNLETGGELHVHARMADGSWLVDLVLPVAANGIDADDVARLQPIAADGMRTVPPPSWTGNDRGTALLLAARWLQAGLGQPGAALAAYDAALASERSSQRSWPRRPSSRDPEDALRWALVGWFLGEWPAVQPRRPEAAIAIAPPAYREALTQDMQRRSRPPGACTGDLAAISGWRQGSATTAPLPELADAVLIAAIANADPAVGADRHGMAIGDRALAMLDLRWGLDPVLISGRDPSAPWTDAERTAVADALRRWSAVDTGRPLPERLGRALAAAPADEITPALARRLSRMGRDGKRVHADQGELGRALLAALGERWRDGPPVMRPARLHQLLGLALNHDAAPLCAAADAWRPEPWSAEVLAVWGDRRGRPQAVDAQVEAWLQRPEADSPLLSALSGSSDYPPGEHPAYDTPLCWWVSHADASRWQRLTALVGADPKESRATARLLAGLAGTWQGHGATVAPALAWLALADQRPAPTSLVLLAQYRARLMRRSDTQVEDLFDVATAGPDPADLRICDVVALDIAVDPYPVLDWNGVRTLAKAAPALFDGLLAQAPAGRDAAIGLLRTHLSVPAHACLTRLQLPVPDGLHPARIEVADAPVAIAPGLTEAEAVACRTALEQAVALGFPDLAGATVMTGTLVRGGGGSWYGPHLRLADGSWLADCLVPVPADRVLAGGDPTPPAASNRQAGWSRLDRTATARAALNDRLGKLAERPEKSGFAALAWWRSGADPDGGCIIAAAAAAVCADVDIPGRMAIAVQSHTSAGEGPQVALPGPETAVRRTCGRWFRERLRIARDADEARRWHAAAVSILDPDGQAAWRPHLDALRAARDIPDAAAGDVLERRLACWQTTGRDLWDGQWEGEAPPLRATWADADGLVALLGDTRPCRWIDDGMPRTLGDNALRALGQLTGVDWRWLAIDDPAVAALAPPPDPKQGGEVARWHRWAWTAEQRAAMAAAIQAWWPAHRAGGASGAAAAVIERLPVAQWDDALGCLPQALVDDATGAAVGRVLLRWRLPRDRDAYFGGMREAVMASLRWPGHPGVTQAVAGWPTAAWRGRLLQLRDQLNGGSAYDPLIADWLAGRLAVPSERGSGWDWRSCLDPANNLGLWAHALTADRLAALRACLAGPLEDGPALWLVAKLGFGRLDICGDWTATDRFTAGRTAPYAGTAALALAGLDDRRVVPPDRIAYLAGCAAHGEHEAKDIPGLRVCDWVAHQFMIGHERLGLDLLPDGADRILVFRAADRAERDRQIAILRTAFAPVVARQLAEAGLPPEP